MILWIIVYLSYSAVSPPTKNKEETSGNAELFMQLLLRHTGLPTVSEQQAHLFKTKHNLDMTWVRKHGGTLVRIEFTTTINNWTSLLNPYTTTRCPKWGICFVLFYWRGWGTILLKPPVLLINVIHKTRSMGLTVKINH